MGSTARKLQTMTLAEYESLPKEERVEVIRGFVYNMAGPSLGHQRISGQIFTQISNHINKKKGSCEVYAAPTDVRLKKNPLTIVQPDIFVVCNPRKTENGKRCEGAPDWIIEIISPSNPEHDYLTKLNLYKEAGVREFWIVDAEKERVFVYILEKKKFDLKEYQFGERIKVGIYEDLYLTV